MRQRSLSPATQTLRPARTGLIDRNLQHVRGFWTTVVGDMKACRRTRGRHPRARAIRLGLLPVILLIASFAASASASAHGRTKVVSYHGYRVVVPVAWPVYRLARDAKTCVRFDRHAVYLGAPGSDQRCPAVAVGRTEAILVAPLNAHGARAGASGGTALPAVTVPRAQRNGGSSLELPDAARGVLVTATWGRHPEEIRTALGVGSLQSSPVAAASAARARSARAHTASGSGAPFQGLGFDACSAPSESSMSAWAASYGAAGIYVGGANMACTQTNLTASWTNAESAAGWHLIPIYVGLQSPTSSCGCATIAPKQAASEGAAAATDAVNLMASLGLGPGSPIYFDMEAYTVTTASTSAVLAFLGAWSSTLHANGYLSGVYSSAASGIRDFARAAGTTFVEPDDIWIADWNGAHTTADANVPSDQWMTHQRIHQYAGGHNETHGGVTIDVDNDFLDGATATTGAILPDGTFVQVAGAPATYRIAGGAPLYVSSWSGFGGQQPFTVISEQRFAALRPVPASRTFLQTTSGGLYRVAGGAPLLVSNPSLFGAPPLAVTVDEWDLENVSNPAAHLLTRPVNGTVVEGLPSDKYWQFKSGARMSIPPSPAAVQVDDVGLAQYPVRPVPKPPACVVPSLRHLGVGAARRALRRARCQIGKVHRPKHVARRHFLRVVRQSPRARTVRRVNYVVGITVS